jgi:hypothetical protein
MDEMWKNEEILNTMREFIEKASKREAVCECNKIKVCLYN